MITTIDGRLRITEAQLCVTVSDDFKPLGDREFQVLGYAMFDTRAIHYTPACPDYLKSEIERRVQPFLERGPLALS